MRLTDDVECLYAASPFSCPLAQAWPPNAFRYHQLTSSTQKAAAISDTRSAVVQLQLRLFCKQWDNAQIL